MTVKPLMCRLGLHKWIDVDIWWEKVSPGFRDKQCRHCGILHFEHSTGQRYGRAIRCITTRDKRVVGRQTPKHYPIAELDTSEG